MKLDVLDMLNEYGVDLKVQPFHKEYDDFGVKVSDSLDKWESRHEPVYPANGGSLANIISGGTIVSDSLIWLSSKDYKIGTVVDVHGQKYRVKSKSNYLDYATLVKYELEGDSQSKDGY
ncbi:hypothetical protein [Lactobacillus sp.]|uniref:hypothetical protein n=1 Tax=Lactobacillus sp. TaxID=1591 RepID=UPI0019BD89FC|nr:hypothetical protein [Lactobacillus sp.]MBD5430140.1 hypothetical protein [Lactobacillus sp.]